MPRVKLNARNVATLPVPAAGQVDYWDSEAIPGGWFGLRVSAGSKRTYTVGYRASGRVRRMTLGPAPTLSLADARDLARKVLADVVRGLDPQAGKSQARKRGTVGELSAEWLASREAREWQPKTGKEFVRIVENEILPGLGRLKADEVKKGDIRALVDKIAERAPTMARRTRGVLRLLYAWAVEHDRVAAMPPFPKPLGQGNRRSRVLAESEIQRAWQAMDAESGILGSAFKLMLLTGQRRGEVLQMRWRNVTEETGPTAGWWWMIPAEFAKNGRAHRVPLSPQAIGILDHLRPITGQGEWVFPSPHQGKGPILNPQKAAERLWKRARIEDATLHDLRRTCGTFVSGFFGASGRFVVKLLLNHSDREVTAIYDRHSYDAEKRQALEEWGKRLTGIISGNGGPGLIPALKQGVVGAIPTGPSNQAGD